MAMRYEGTQLELIKKESIGKLYYKDGKCKKSQFLAGGHRCFKMPFESALDGGASGDFHREVCVDCGKMFKAGCFVIKKQPSSIGKKVCRS